LPRARGAVDRAATSFFHGGGASTWLGCREMESAGDPRRPPEPPPEEPHPTEPPAGDPPAEEPPLRDPPPRDPPREDPPPDDPPPRDPPPEEPPSRTPHTSLTGPGSASMVSA
jgi:hypothetical protein